MKKSIIIVLFFAFTCCESLFAQKSFAIGASVGTSEGKNANVSDSFGIPTNINRTLVYYGLNLAYRTNTKVFGNAGIGLNIPITIGYGNGGIYFDGAAMAQYQMGALSNSDNSDKKGYYFGAGLGIVHATWVPVVTGTHQIKNITANSITPVFEVGSRFRVGRAEYYTDICFFYKLNSTPEAKHKILGFKALYYIK